MLKLAYNMFAIFQNSGSIYANSKIEVQFMHSRTNMIHNTIVFFLDLWIAIGHIEHLLKRDSSLNSLS